MSPRDPSPWMLAAGGFLALAAAMGIGRFAYTPILPDMMAAGVLDGAGAGYLAAANFAGYLLGALAAASPLVPGRRAVWVVAALLASAATTAAMGMVESPAAFAWLRFLGGFSSAIVLVFATAVVLDGWPSPGATGCPRCILPVSGSASWFRPSSCMGSRGRDTGPGSGSSSAR